MAAAADAIHLGADAAEQERLALLEPTSKQHVGHAPPSPACPRRLVPTPCTLASASPSAAVNDAGVSPPPLPRAADSGSGSNKAGTKRPRPLQRNKDAATSPLPHAARTGLYYDAIHQRHKHPTRKHPERPERVDAVMAHLEAKGLLADGVAMVLGGAEAAGYEALAGVHNTHYLQRLKRLESTAPPPSMDRLLEEAEQFDSVYLNEATVECARKAAGGLMQLVEAVVSQRRLRNGMALIRPPGHHAEAHHARGFCVLNNVAVAAAYARRELGVGKVLICDWDVHHGQGTQRMFLDDPSVLYFSVHRYDHGRFFPGTGAPSVVGEGAGEGYTLNVAWNEGGMGDAEYRRVWTQVLLPVAQAFAPELILVSAGFDGAEGDEMGGCRVTPQGGFGEMTRMLMAGVPSAQGRVVLALEGGYKLSVLAECVEACLTALMYDAEAEEKEGAKKARVEEEEEEEEEEPIREGAAEAIATTVALHRKYWPCLGAK